MRIFFLYLIIFNYALIAEDLESLSRDTEVTESKLSSLREEVNLKKNEVVQVEKEIASFDRKIKLQKEELAGLKEKETQVLDEINRNESDLKIERERIKDIFKGIILKADSNLRIMVSVPKVGAAEMGTYLRGISKYQGKILSSYGKKLAELDAQKADLLLMRDEKEIVLKDQERNLAKVKELRQKRAEELKALEKQSAEVKALLLNLKQRSLRVQTALKGIGSSVTIKDALKGIQNATKPIDGIVTKDFKSKKAYQFIKGTAASQGIEFRGKAGDNVNSIAKGKVSFAGSLPGYGKVVILDHGNREYSLYGNLGTVSVSKGDIVDGKLGNLSDSGGLYFEIRKEKNPVDPSEYFN